MSDRADPALPKLIERLKAHLDATQGAVVISLSSQGDYLCASEWGATEDPSHAYGMGASPTRAMDDMLHEAGLPS